MSAVKVRVCSVGDLTEGVPATFDVAGRQVCMVACKGRIHAIDDVCSHEDYPLSDGEVDADACEIECPYHGSVFSLVTGEALTLPATRPVAVHGVEVEGDDVVVTLR